MFESLDRVATTTEQCGRKNGNCCGYKGHKKKYSIHRINYKDCVAKIIHSRGLVFYIWWK